MEKKIILTLLLVYFSCFSFSQEVEKSQKLFTTYDGWFLNDVHALYGYEYTNGKNNFTIGLSIERKRIPVLNYYNYSRFIYGYSGDFFTYPYILKDTSFSVAVNNLKFGYSYIFRPEKKMTAYPFVNMFINHYRKKGTYVGLLTSSYPSSVSGSDAYLMDQWMFNVNIGFGFRFQMNEKLSLKIEFGAGNLFFNDYFSSAYYGSKQDWSWWVSGFGSFGVFYRFK